MTNTVGARAVDVAGYLVILVFVVAGSRLLS